MRDSINGLWLLGIVMVLMVFLIAFVAISLNYSNAFRMKSEMVNIVEQYNGINPTTVQKLEGIASSYGYRVTNKCKQVENAQRLGIKDGYVTKDPRDAQEMCVFMTSYDSNCGNGYNCDKKYVYEINVFFSFDLPLFGNIFNFTVSGETKDILYPEESYFET